MSPPTAGHGGPGASETKPAGLTPGGTIEVVTATGQTIKLEGEYEVVNGAEEQVTRRIKEHDKVTILICEISKSTHAFLICSPETTP